MTFYLRHTKPSIHIFSSCCLCCVTGQHNPLRGNHYPPPCTCMSSQNTRNCLMLLWLTGETVHHPSHPESTANFALLDSVAADGYSITRILTCNLWKIEQRKHFFFSAILYSDFPYSIKRSWLFHQGDTITQMLVLFLSGPMSNSDPSNWSRM